MITTIYTIALLAIFAICMIAIFRKTSIYRKLNKEKPTHWQVEQLISKIGCLEIQLKELYEKNKAKSKRIAELIELCDKLQPDLVQSDSDYHKKCIDLVNERLAFHLNNIDRKYPQKNEAKKIYFEGLFKKMENLGYTPNIHVIDRKHIENMENVSRVGIVNCKIDVEYKDDWFKELKDGEAFYYYYTFGNCVMEGSKPMNYKIDSCIKPRRTREEAEKDKEFYNSQKQK